MNEFREYHWLENDTADRLLAAANETAGAGSRSEHARVPAVQSRRSTKLTRARRAHLLAVSACSVNELVPTVTMDFNPSGGRWIKLWVTSPDSQSERRLGTDLTVGQLKVRPAGVMCRRGGD